MDNEKNGYPCIQVSMYPNIHDIQVSTYPSIQRKSVSKIFKYPDIRKKVVSTHPYLSSIFLLLTILLSESVMFGPLGGKSESQTVPILISDVLSPKKLERRSGIILTFDHQHTLQSIYKSCSCQNPSAQCWFCVQQIFS